MLSNRLTSTKHIHKHAEAHPDLEKAVSYQWYIGWFPLTCRGKLASERTNLSVYQREAFAGIRKGDCSGQLRTQMSPSSFEHQAVSLTRTLTDRICGNEQE